MNPNADIYTKANRDFGLASEKVVIKQLKEYFNEDIKSTIERFCPYDAYSENYKYEIKTRRNKYSTYPTTIISLTKINTEGNLRFVFSFTDGLYYIDYDKEIFLTFKVQDITIHKPVKHILIPIENLIKIN